MKLPRLFGLALVTATVATASLLVAGSPDTGGPVKNRSLGLRPGSSEVWLANKDNDAVVVMDRTTGAVLNTVAVGVSPRNVAFNSTGSKVYVTNQRGDVALDKTFLEYTHSEKLGSVSVIDAATKAVIKTITTGIGVEPFGIALAPNGKYLLVTNFRSSSLSVIDPATDNVVATFQYDANLNFVPAGKTMADLDSNGDFIADLDGPRGIAIRAASDRAYITHLKSGFVSVVSLALNGSGVPTSLSLAKRIDLNRYPYDNFANPVKITAALSQGTPKFLEDITITPDGTKAYVPHVLHNV
ncbi:MAG TPA: YncE family protein, partial [Planctomycetota bacterium]|nr:YncE family protein [Planctomycetota bacterium]